MRLNISYIWFEAVEFKISKCIELGRNNEFVSNL